MLQFSFRQARRLPSLEKVFDGKTSLFNPGMLQDELSKGLNIVEYCAHGPDFTVCARSNQIELHRPTPSSQSPRGRGVGGGFTQSHRALGRSLPACRNRWARLFVKQVVSGQPRRGNRARQRHRASHLQRATPRQPGANESSRPTGTSATGPADRLPDPHATAAPAHPRASRQPGFELRPWPQGTLIVAFRSAKGTSTPRRAKVDERRLARRQSVLSLVTQMGLTLRIRCNLSQPPASPQHRCEPCLEKSVRCGRGLKNGWLPQRRDGRECGRDSEVTGPKQLKSAATGNFCKIVSSVFSGQRNS